MQEARRSDQMTVKVLVVYTTHKVMVGSRVQKFTQLSNSV